MPMNVKAADLNFNLIESYLGLLNSLSPDNELELISKLSDSLKKSKQPSERPLGSLYGAFLSKRSVDEIITDIRNSRNFNRSTEAFE